MHTAQRQIRCIILPDFLEEAWPSMDLCAEMLSQHLPAQSGWQIETKCPGYRHWFKPPHPRPLSQSTGGEGAFQKIGRNADRLFNRWWSYPRYVRQFRQQYEFFHVVDHSYAHLVHQLPANRTGVYCHDLDAFRCLTQPKLEPRPWWFRHLATRILSGLEKAAIVFYSTEAVKAEMLRFGLLDPAKLIHAPYGVDESFTACEPNVPYPVELAQLQGEPWLLHVGATIPRKRIDVLLNVFAAARQRWPKLQLCKIGADWTAEQQAQIEQLDLSRAILHLGKVAHPTLVSAYQRASAVLVTSDAEGFGLPVIEALACGAPVIASDIPVLRESGGSAAIFAPVADIDAWSDSVCRVMTKAFELPVLEHRLAWAAKFSWSEHARIIADAYRRLLLNEQV